MICGTAMSQPGFRPRRQLRSRRSWRGAAVVSKMLANELFVAEAVLSPVRREHLRKGGWEWAGRDSNPGHSD